VKREASVSVNDFEVDVMTDVGEEKMRSTSQSPSVHDERMYVNGVGRLWGG
jgi:hypothetical protein